VTAYYNEHDPYAAQWLRNLITAGHIAPGDVDERDIRDIKPEELKKYTQLHFFAGIGVWSLALRQAGWPDDQPVWTGSCPCQPFSAAGRKAGVNDERHLWPHWFHLITQCEPRLIFGEQVASKDGLTWLDLVQTDLEGAGYANGAVDLCAAGIGAPHIRQRLWFVAERLEHAQHEGLQGRVYRGPHTKWQDQHRHVRRDSTIGGVADTNSTRPQSGRETSEAARYRNTFDTTSCTDRNSRPDQIDGFWKDVDWLGCKDGKFRPVRPGSFPLVNGTTSRVGKLRAYGNCINAKAAEEVISAYLQGGK